MKITSFKCNSKVLLLGEGNFSFAIDLFHHDLHLDLTATCYQNTLNDNEKNNSEYLKQNGVQVLLGVDATKLNQHAIISKEKFDFIIFNFPHSGGKMKINKNRELIKNIFISAATISKFSTIFIMTLCNGQGGTPADSCLRIWKNSWQVTEMAAHGNFLLIAAYPFDFSLFKNYVVTGYRSLQKPFNSNRAITHIFCFNDKLNIENIVSLQFLNFEEICKTSHENPLPLTYFPKYQFDITILVNSKLDNEELYKIIHTRSRGLIKNVTFLHLLEFPDGKESRTFRLDYQTNLFPMYRKLAIDIHQNIIPKIIEKYLDVTILR